MDIQIRGYLCSNDEADILRWWGWRDITAPMDIEKALKEAAGEPVTVLINSPGGDMTVGGELFSMFKRYSGHTEALVQGYAASAATMAMTGCRIIRSEPGALLCYHNPSGITEGDYKAMEAMAEGLRNARESVINIYMTRSGKAREDIGALMDKDVWISPQQALEYGLIDEIVGLVAEGEPAPPLIAAAAALTPRITSAMRQKYRESIAAKNDEIKANCARAKLRALANY